MLLNFKFAFEFYRAIRFKIYVRILPRRAVKIYARQRPLFADRRKRLADKFLSFDLVYYGEREVCVADVAFALAV